jgi:Holliday junction resolvase RusA-like endonuclease
MEKEVVYITKHAKKQVEITLMINPMGAVRTTRKGKHTDRAKKYHDWMNTVQWLYRKALLDLCLPTKALPDGVIDYIEFGIEVGKTTAKRIGTPHTIKPDWDNLSKAVLDAIFYEKDIDDCTIHTVGGVKKLWVARGGGYIRMLFCV